MDSPTDDKSNYFTMNPNQPLISSNRPVVSPHSPVPVAPMVVTAPETQESTSCCHFSNNFYLTAAFGFTLSVICVFQTVFLFVLGYILPTCFCSDFWRHLNVLSPNAKLIYSVLVIFLSIFTILGFICLRGLLVESKQKIMPFLVLLAITQAAIIIGSIVGGVKGTQAFQAQMDNASAEMAEDFIDMIFVEKWAKLIKTLIDASDILLPNKEELHITDLMDDMLKPEVHHQLEAIQQMTVFAGGMLMLGLNILMFGTLFLLVRVIQRMNKFEKFMASQQQHPAYMVPNGNNYYSPYPSAITPTGLDTSRRRSNYAASIASKKREEPFIAAPSSRDEPALQEAEYLTK